jgi:hypothetical protein
MPKPKATLRDRFKSALRERGLTLKDLHGMLGKGVPYSSLAEIYQGNSKTSKYTPMIAAALGVNAPWLAEGIGPESGSGEVESGMSGAARRLQGVGFNRQLTEDEIEVVTLYGASSPEEKAIFRRILDANREKKRKGV